MSTDYATVPAEHNWRHLAPQIRELPDGRATELAGLAEMLVGRLAPGALTDRTLRVVPPGQMTPADAARLHHLLGKIYAATPPEPSVADLALAERAFRLIGERKVVMAIRIGHELRGGSLDGRALTMDDFVDHNVVDRLLALGGAGEDDDHDDELLAEAQAAMGSYFAELDAGLPSWPDEDNASRDEAGLEPEPAAGSKPDGQNGGTCVDEALTAVVDDGHRAVASEVRAQYERLCSAMEPLADKKQRLERDVRAAESEPARLAAAQRLEQVTRDYLAAVLAPDAYLRDHPDLMAIYGTAARAMAVGINPLPVKADGTKRPDLTAWKPYQTQLVTPDEAYEWFSQGDHGIAVICGAISNNLEMFELEGRAIDEGLLEEFTGHLAAARLMSAWQRVTSGYVELSPSHGAHFYWRCEEIAGAIKLACRLATEEELQASPKEKYKTLIETRGEGGYSVIAPTSGACHKTGRPWRVVTGSLEAIATITPDEREGILACARKCSKLPPGLSVHDRPERREHQAIEPGEPVVLRPDSRPGDIYNATGPDWADIITPHGWQLHHTDKGVGYWTRPGKTDGTSATTSHPNHRGDKLHVFTSSTEFEPDHAYSKFEAYAVLNHGGNFRAAAADLAEQGFTPETPAGGGGWPDPLADDDSPWEPRSLESVHTGLDERRRVQIGTEPVTVRTLSWAIATGALSDQIYVQNDQLIVAGIGQDGELDITPLSADRFRSLSSERDLCYRLEEIEGSEQAYKEVRVLPAPGLCNVALANPAIKYYRPALHGVTGVPVARPDGTLLQVKEFDPATGVIYWPAFPVAAIGQVTPEMVASAKEFLLTELLGDFPWATPGDKANWLAVMVTHFLRPYGRRYLAPLVALTATQSGTGKTTLTDTLTEVIGATVRSWENREEEIRKALTTTLMESKPVVLFDDVDRDDVVKSATLAKALTHRIWDDRILGVNKNFRGENDRIWILTGNNLTLGGDIPQRALLVRLDPGMDDPKARPVVKFALGDLREWIRNDANKARLVECLLILIADWIQAGAPEKPYSYRFQRWAAIMGGLLEHHKIEGFLVNADAVEEHTDDTQSLVEFAARWYERYGKLPLPLRPLCREAMLDKDLGPWHGLFPETAGGKPLGEKALGRRLRNDRGKPYGDYCFRGERDSHAKSWRYWVECSDDQVKAGEETEPNFDTASRLAQVDLTRVARESS